MSTPLIVSFGAGINSAAMIVGMHTRGITPDAILFADTGNEKPETYSFLGEMRSWTEENMGLTITSVGHPKGDTLRESCFRNGTLPSKAYGFSGCAVKFKHQPMEKYESQRWGTEIQLTKAIGYHAGEIRRSDIKEKGRYHYRYFLREWGWRQAECISAIKAAGLTVPIKSACYFCPSSKAHEIVWLRDVHPDLFEDSLAMERNAVPYHTDGGNKTKGLGRRFSWGELISISEQGSFSFPDTDEVPCMCYDGGDELE